MKIINADDKTFDEYVASSYKPHFMQTSAWADVNNLRGSKTHKLLFTEDNSIAGGAMLI